MDKNYKENTPIMKQVRDSLPTRSPVRALKKESFEDLQKYAKSINAALQSGIRTGKDADFLKSFKPIVEREMKKRTKPMKNGGAVMPGRGGKFKGVS